MDEKLAFYSHMNCGFLLCIMTAVLVYCACEVNQEELRMPETVYIQKGDQQIAEDFVNLLMERQEDDRDRERLTAIGNGINGALFGGPGFIREPRSD